MRMSWLDWVTLVLLYVGGLNWGLVGFLDLNLVEAILGTGTVTTVVYALVGLSTLWMIYKHAKM